MEQIKSFRNQISIFINSIPFLNPSREVSLAKTCLERSFMFLGLCLKYMGGENPYPDSTNPDSKKIENTADQSIDSFIKDWESLGYTTQIARVKDFRSEIESTTTEIRNINHPIEWEETCGKIADMAYEFYKDAYKSLVEAKGWLGWELARIKRITEQSGQTVPLAETKKELPLV